MKISLLSLLNQDSYRTYTVPVARYLGSVHAAIMLSEIINRHEYHERRNELIECPKNGMNWFYYTQEMAEERTFLSRREQDSAIKTLIEKEMIEAVVFGLPAKRHFRLRIEKIEDAFGNSNKHSRMAENAKLDGAKTPNYDGGKRQTAPQGKTGRIHIEETEEENKEDVLVCSGEPVEKISCPLTGADFCEILLSSGEKLKLRADEIFTYAVQARKDWKTPEIIQAWEAISKCKDKISSWEKYVEGIIDRIRTREKSQQIAKLKEAKKCKDQEKKSKESHSKCESTTSAKTIVMRPFLELSSPNNSRKPQMI